MSQSWLAFSVFFLILLVVSDAASKCEDLVKTCSKVSNLCREQGKKGDFIRYVDLKIFVSLGGKFELGVS